MSVHQYLLHLILKILYTLKEKKINKRYSFVSIDKK